VIGYGGRTINTLRLWSATAAHGFDFERFSAGDFVASIAEALNAESLTRVLYPDDQGRALRLVQEYFLVACSLADIVRRFREKNKDWDALPEKAAIQLNDTHPALAVPELMRILLDEAHLGWDDAWDIAQRTLAYTNHTLLPEALERWPVEWLEFLAPRQLEIIFEINRRLLDHVNARFPGDRGRAGRVSLIEEGQAKLVCMANLAIVGSHSTNGVAAIHSELLRTTTVRDLAETFPERFNNKTNGVTPRRWLKLCNPPLAKTITAAIGDSWVTDLGALQKLRPLADDAAFRGDVRKAKRTAKARLADWLKANSDLIVDPETILDCQVKRIHEYKRQLLNALRIVVLYQRLRENPSLDMTPRTFIFAGKAAPAYQLAKVIIKFTNNLACTLDADPAIRDKLKVAFLPEYNVSLAERIIPAADVSNQISTAGYEASGTSNMKFMMNGALTLGTRDGATIEMAEEAGEENFFLFGLTSEQVAGSRAWYNPHWHYENEPETRAALDLSSPIISARTSRESSSHCAARSSPTATITCTSPTCAPTFRPMSGLPSSIARRTIGPRKAFSMSQARESFRPTAPLRNTPRKSGARSPVRLSRPPLLRRVFGGSTQSAPRRSRVKPEPQNAVASRRRLALLYVTDGIHALSAKLTHSLRRRRRFS
jgi:glycogen phosphorylase